MSKTCAFCNLSLVQKDYETDEKFQQRKYCDKTCQLEAMHKNNERNTYRKGIEPANKGKKMPAEFCENASIRAKKERVEKIIVKCEFCGKEKKLTPNKAKWRKHNFCNRTCRAGWDSTRLQGNQNRLNKKHTPETIKKIKEKRSLQKIPKGAENPLFGRNLPKVTKDKISSALTGKRKSKTHGKNIGLAKEGEKNPQFGKPAPNRGQHPSESTREKIIEARLYQSMPSSEVEKILQQELRLHGIEFQENIPIFGHPDIFILPNICIFVDGEYDHADPKKYKPDDIIRVTKIAKLIRAYDKDVTESLEEMGMTVLRFWGNDVKKDPKTIVDQIIEKINSLTLQHSDVNV